MHKQRTNDGVGFQEVLEKMENKDIAKLVDNILSDIPQKFWEVPSSSTGKYHPPENNEDGGLIKHTLKLVQVAAELMRFFEDKSEGEKSSNKISVKGEDNPYLLDHFIAAGILHDAYKYGLDWEKKYTTREHASDSAKIVKIASRQERTPDIDPDDIEKICKLVECHMSRWSYPDPAPAKNKAELLIQLADYIAARKTISFTLPGWIVDLG